MSRYERLTSWDNGNPYVRECFERTPELGGCEHMDTSRCVWCEHNLDTVRRLAQYEDSGLSPEQVAEVNNFEKSQCAKLFIENEKLKTEIQSAKDAARSAQDLNSEAGNTITQLLAERDVYINSGLSPEQLEAFLERVVEAMTGQKERLTQEQIDIVLSGELKTILDKLAEYESTWLSPEGVAELLQCRWISVSEKLPEEGDTVLMWHKTGFVMLAVNIFDEIDEITHWMPLPAGPECMMKEGQECLKE